MRPLLLTLAALVAVSVCVTLAWVVCGVMAPDQLAIVSAPTDATGDATVTAITRPTPLTPNWPLIGVGLSWLATFGAAVGLGVRWLVTRNRTRPEEKR